MSADDLSEAVEEVGDMFAELLDQTCGKIDKMETPQEFAGIVAGLFKQTHNKLNNMEAFRRVMSDRASSGSAQQTPGCSVTPYEEPKPLIGEVPAITNPPYDSDGRSVLTATTEATLQARPAQPVKFYKNDSSPRGIVVIFNYIFKNNFKKLRKGARRDHENLHAVFTEMGYDVWPINIDKTRQETMDKLDEVRNSSKLKEVDSLITVFLSHGGEYESEFLAFDERPISVHEIIYTKFTDQECPHMKGKPKLFIFNYCRGSVLPFNSLQYDDIIWKPDTQQLQPPSDVAVIQATLPYFKAGRYSDTGTIFVSEFCKILEQYSESLELVDLVNETSKKMREDSHGNTPTVWPIHFEKFKFT